MRELSGEDILIVFRKLKGTPFTEFPEKLINDVVLLLKDKNTSQVAELLGWSSVPDKIVFNLSHGTFFIESNAAANRLIVVPSLKNKIKSVAAAALDSALLFVDGKEVFVSDEVVKRRRAVCKGSETISPCPLYQTFSCLKCGCFIWAKTLLVTESCPEGKWL